jgi:heme-degrading monooxygenase HmoA
MAVKILIQRKVKPGKEKELIEVVRELRSQAMHAEGFISGETLRCIEDPSVHLVISTWQSLDAWNAWIESPRRRALQKKVDEILAEPSTKTAFQFE